MSLHQGWHMIDEVDLACLTSSHAALRLLCHDLELLADDLPKWPDCMQRQDLASRLESALKQHEAAEKRFLGFMFRSQRDPLAATLLAHIRHRHIRDTMHAQDLVEALRVNAGHVGARAEALGYMLRCFFDGCRRALDFEELAVLAIARQRLTEGARAALVESLSRSSHE